MIKRYALILSVFVVIPQVHGMSTLSSLWGHVTSVAAPFLARVQDSLSSQSITSKLTQLADSRFAGYCTLTALTCASLVGTYILAKKLFGTSNYSKSRTQEPKRLPTTVTHKNTIKLATPTTLKPDLHTLPSSPDKKTSPLPRLDLPKKIIQEQPRPVIHKASVGEKTQDPVIKSEVPAQTTQEPHSQVETCTITHQDHVAEQRTDRGTSPATSTVARAQEPRELLPNIPYFNDRENHVRKWIKFHDNRGNNVTVQQLRVRSQFKKGNGGNGSCALQAARRANVALAALTRGLINSLDAQRMLRKQIMDFKEEKTFVHRLRAKHVLKNYYAYKLTPRIQNDGEETQGMAIVAIYDNIINEQLKSMQEADIKQLTMASIRELLTRTPITATSSQLALFGIHDQEEFTSFMHDKKTLRRYFARKQNAIIASIYGRLINVFLDGIITEIVDGETQSRCLNTEQIFDALATMPIELTSRQLIWLDLDPEEFTALMHDKKTMQSHISIAGPLEVSRTNIPVAWHEYNENQQHLGLSPIPENGEWLNEEEISALIEHERTKSNSLLARAYNPEVAVCTIESTEKGMIETNDTIQGLIKAIQEGRTPPFRYYAFHVGTMRQPDQQEGQQRGPAVAGHTTGIFLEAAPKERRWTITNSARNGVQLFNSSPTDLIQSIEGIASQGKFKPTPQFLEKNVTKVETYLTVAESAKSEIRGSRIPSSIRSQLNKSKKRLDRAVQKFETFSSDYSKFGNKEALYRRINALQVSEE